MISQKEVHQNAVDHLFWQSPIDILEKLCFIHLEISEAMEAYRAKDLADNNMGEELADAVIRIMDLCEFLNIDLEHEIEMKHKYNKTRPI